MCRRPYSDINEQSCRVFVEFLNVECNVTTESDSDTLIHPHGDTQTHTDPHTHTDIQSFFIRKFLKNIESQIWGEVFPKSTTNSECRNLKAYTKRSILSMNLGVGVG